MSSFSRHWSFGSALIGGEGFALSEREDWMAFGLTNGIVSLLPALDEPNKAKEIRVANGQPFVLRPDADAHAFLVGTQDGRLLIVEPEIDSPTEIFSDPSEPFLAVAGSSAGLRAAATPTQFILLDPSGKTKARLPLPAKPCAMQFHPAGKRLAILFDNSTLWLVWTNTKTPQVETVSLPAASTSLRWMDNALLLTGSDTAPLIFLPLGKEPLILPPAEQAQPDASGRYLLGLNGNKVLAWPWPLPQTPPKPDERIIPARINHIAPHPREAFTALATDQGAILLLPHDGRPEAMVLPATGKPCATLLWSNDGALLFAPLLEGAILLFTAKSILR